MTDLTIKLNAQQANSPTWLFLREHMTKALDGLRTDLENPKLTVEQTASVRGKIVVLRDLLALEKGQAQTSSPGDRRA